MNLLDRIYIKVVDKNKILILIVLFLLITTLPLLANAADPIVPCGKNADTGDVEMCGLCHLIVGIKNIIDYMVGILLFVATLSLVGGAILYVISAGNEQTMEKAKNIMKKTALGFTIMLSAWAIINYAMILAGGIDGNGDGVPDFGYSTTGWNDFSCN